MTFLPKPQEIYRHFKGNLYQIVTVAEHTETGEALVVYQAMYGEFKIYARPLEMFCSKVDKSKYPDVEQEYRFEMQRSVGIPHMNEAAPEEVSVGVEVVPVPIKAVEYGTNEEQSVEETVTECVSALEEGETVKAEFGLESEEPALDPMLLAFLDADTYEEKLNILAGMHHRITDEMITTMAIASDVEIPEGDLESRYVQLKNCLLTLDRYEITRLR